MNTRPKITICIPTFNRSRLVVKLVEEILSTKNKFVNVLVLDNCSTDDTVKLLNEFNDSRFKLEINEKNIGGPLNVIKVLSLVKSDYSLLCLDKDYINVDKIVRLIEIFDSSPEISFGHCVLNSNIVGQNKYFKKGIDSLLNMSYLSIHPSGFFYKTSDFIKINYLDEILQTGLSFPFNLDIINAEMSFYGCSLLFDEPLVYTEKEEDCAKIISFSYNKNNVWFSPKNRFLELKMYVNNLYKLNICNDDKKIILKRLLKTQIYNATYQYKSFMNNSSVCMHHNILPRKISKLELLIICIYFIFSFVIRISSFNLFYRFKLGVFVIAQNVKRILLN